MAIENNINDEIGFLNKITEELNDLYDRCRDILKSKNKYSNDTLLLPVLISRITSLTEVFEEKYNSLCDIIAKADKMAASNVSTITSNENNNSILNITWHRKAHIFSEQLTNYKYLLTKLIRDSREVQSFEMSSKDTFSKFKNRKITNSDNDFSALYTTNMELEDTVFQGINTLSLLSAQNKRLGAIKHKLIGLLRLVSISDATIVNIYKYARMNQRIITFGFIAALLLFFIMYYYF